MKQKILLWKAILNVFAVASKLYYLHTWLLLFDCSATLILFAAGSNELSRSAHSAWLRVSTFLLQFDKLYRRA